MDDWSTITNYHKRLTAQWSSRSFEMLLLYLIQITHSSISGQTPVYSFQTGYSSAHISWQHRNLKEKLNHLPPEWKLESLFIATLGLTTQKKDPKKWHAPSWLCSAVELSRYALLYAYRASSMKIDLCLLSKQWIIHLNASNWSGLVFLLFPTDLPSLSY